MDDRIFQGRLRVVSIGELCELRLEETGRCFTDVASMLLCVEMLCETGSVSVTHLDGSLQWRALCHVPSAPWTAGGCCGACIRQLPLLCAPSGGRPD